MRARCGRRCGFCDVIATCLAFALVAAAAPDPIGGTHLTATTVADGIAGHAEFWVTRDGYREFVREPDGTRERVDRPDSAWVRDWNGWTRALEGRDLRDETTNAFLRGIVFAGDPRAVLATAGAREVGDDSTSAFRRIAFTPPGGVACVIDVDRATGLPARALRCAYDDTTTLWFDDWRAIGASRLPFRLRETGRNGRADTTTVLTAQTAQASAAWSFERPPDGPSDVAWPIGVKEASVRFDFTTEHIMVEGSVDGGSPSWFLFDTGADVTVINRARLKEMGLKEFGAAATSGGGNATSSAFTRVPSLAVGGVAVLGQRATTLDLTGLEKLYGMKLGGLLGYDFTSRFVIVVDYERQTFTLHPRGFRGAAGTALPFVLEQAHPHVAGAVVVDDGSKIGCDFVIDSGAAESANLTAPFVSANHLLERARKTPPPPAVTTPGMAGQFFAQTSVRGFLKELHVGEVSMHAVPVNLQQGTSGAYSLASFSGTVGERVLSRFTNTYDYGRSTILLVPGRDANKPFAPRTTFGVSWLADGPEFTTFTVSGVRKGSPAEAAGFQKGDVLVSLDDRPATDLRLATLQAALRDDGASHTADVKRSAAAPVHLVFKVTTVSIEDR